MNAPKELHIAGGFWAGILSHPVHKRTGWDLVSPEASSHGQGVCLNRQNGVGPATDSLGHRARACYIPCSL